MRITPDFFFRVFGFGPKKLLKSHNRLCLRLLIIYYLGYALRVTKYSF